ncbi:MAG: ATP-binding protein [Candidatus Krumholzibacteriota bacterium]
MAAPERTLKGADLHDTLYRGLLRHALVRLTFLYFIPLLLLTLFFHLQYRLVVRDAEQRHRESLAYHQAAMLEMYLGDRLLNLTDLTDRPSSLLEPRREDLEAHLANLRTASEAFIDLSVLDGEGRVLGYAGPLPFLEEKNYRGEDWYQRLLSGPSTHVITDVYLGFRRKPHFTMALKLEPQGNTRILRAVLSPEIARAQVDAPVDDLSQTADGLMANIATNIWWFSALFCLIGGLVIWLQARWVAREQYEAQLKQQQLSRQLGQAAKLALVGELAAGIAHEINNPLAVVAEKAGLVKDLLDPRFAKSTPPGELREHLHTIEDAVYRCTDITRQLLGFVRQRDVELKETDLHQLVDDLVDGLLGPELEVADIEVAKHYDTGMPPIVTDPGQLRQVVLNLLKNAFDSITGPGAITISSRKKGDRFTLTVADTGHGMTPEELELVFIPFFTTKAPGKGTGLGLSVSYGIIEGLGGHMTVVSAPDEGSEFTIELPLRS